MYLFYVMLEIVYFQIYYYLFSLKILNGSITILLKTK